MFVCGYKRVVGSLQVGRSTRYPAAIETSVLENDTFPVYALMPVNEYYNIYRSKKTYEKWAILYFLG